MGGWSFLRPLIILRLLTQRTRAGAGALRASELAWWGPLSTDATLARINEPGAGSGARPNVTALEVNDDAAALGADCLLIGVTRRVAAGEELLLSYGDNYDRSDYGA